MPNLTDTLVQKAPIPTDTKKRLTKDEQIPRLFLQVTRDGARSFVIRYSVNSRERLMTIGRWPTWTSEMARKRAKELLQQVDMGVDPLARRIEAREAPSVKQLAERFLAEHAPTKRPSYLRNNELILNRWILPALGNEKVVDVSPAHVDALFRKISRSGAPIMANRAISCGSKMFSLAERWGWRPQGSNPFRGAVDRNNETRRQIYLKPDQLVFLSEQLKTLTPQARDVLRLILLTGCRRGEALAARVDQIDLPARIWRKPAAATKQNKPHEAHLSAPALELLQRLVGEAERAGRQWLFPGHNNNHMVSVKKSWATLCKRCGLKGVRIHDLRHTFASIAVSRGATLPLIGALLGHSNPQTTSRYAHLYDDPQRALAESVAAVIEGGDNTAETAPLRRGRS